MPLTSSFPDFTGKTIDRGRLLLQSQVGFGGAGVVYKALEIFGSHRCTYAVKWLGVPGHLRNACVAEEEYQNRLANEVRLHGLVSDHPNVLTLHRVLEDRVHECYWMVLDWCPGGDMFNALTERNWWWRDEEKTKRVLLQLADAVAYCHVRGVYHRDIKPENILINEDGSEVYLADFGIATTSEYSNQWRVGTTAYQSPEVIDERFLRARGEEAYSCAQVDAWALGATLFNTLCAVNLWTIADVSELCFYMFTRLPHLNYVYHNFPVSREANALLRDTLALDPGDRLDIAGFRARVAAVHTFFPDAKQLAGADESVQEYIRYNDYYAEVAHKSLRSHDAAAAEAGDEVFTVARPSCKERPVAVALGPAATMSGSAAVAMPAPPSRFSVGSATSASSADSSAPATPQTRAVHAAVAPSDSDVATLVLDASEPDAALTPPTSAFTSLECEAQRGRKGLLCRTIRRVKGSWRRASLVLAG